MLNRKVPLILARRFTTYSGAGDFETIAMNVAAFQGAEIFAWRGPIVGGGTFGISFEESTDLRTWQACDGVEPDTDPGANLEALYRPRFSQRYFRLRVALAGGSPVVTCYAFGYLLLRPQVDDQSEETINASEVAALDDADGLPGEVRSVAVATCASQTLAFVTAGTGGVHIVDVTDPTSPSVLGTINNQSLTAPAELAGRRVDTLAVIDGCAYLVCGAIGSGAVDSSGNGVTVFHIPTLRSILGGSPPYDFSSALLARTGTNVIALPGNGVHRGGGVAGANGRFLAATGGTTLVAANITSGTPGSWSAESPFSPSSPSIGNFLDVVATATHAYASVKSGSDYGIISLQHVPTISVLTTGVVAVSGDFGRYDADLIAGPGNYALDLALDGNVLAVSGDDQVALFEVSNPAVPAPLTAIGETGRNTIAVAAKDGILVVGADSAVRVYEAVTPGDYEFRGQVGHRDPFRARSSQPLPAIGDYVIAAAGTEGLRSIQWT